MQQKLIETCYRKHGTNTTVTMIDDMKNMGYKYSTLASVSFSIFDLKEANEREDIINATDDVVKQNDSLYMQGFVNYEDKKSKNMSLWGKTADDLVKVTSAQMDKFNPLKVILVSGARGSESQLKQLSGMLGNMDAASGGVSDVPIKSNFGRGLSPLEYYSAARGSRKLEDWLILLKTQQSQNMTVSEDWVKELRVLKLLLLFKMVVKSKALKTELLVVSLQKQLSIQKQKKKLLVLMNLSLMNLLKQLLVQELKKFKSEAC